MTTRGEKSNTRLRAAIVGRAGLYTAIGRLAGNATDVPAALDAFARAVDANPNDPAAHKYLAGALLQQDRAGEAFIEFVATLLIDPLDGDAHAGIGQIHLDAGRYGDAVDALRRAVDVRPGHTEARYALATALMRLGKTQEAARSSTVSRQRSAGRSPSAGATCLSMF